MRSSLKIILALILVVTAGIIALVSYRGEVDRRRQESQQPAMQLEEPLASLEPSVADQETEDFTIYFFRASRDPGSVAVGSRTMKLVRQASPTASALMLARASLQESRVSGEGPGVERVFLLKDGTAVVDLARETATGIRGSVAQELGIVQGMARSLVSNLKEVQRVRFLVGGEETDTLAGHVSLAVTFR